MAASADPSGSPSNGNVVAVAAAGGGGGAAAAAGNPSNGSVGAGGGSSGSDNTLKHDPGLSAAWSPEEQAILEDALASYASVPVVFRYAKVAKLLQEKTVRDVALRCRWMTKKESGKRRKEDLTRKSKDKKDRVTDPSAKPPAHLAARPSVSQYALPMLQMDNDDDVSYKAIGGVTGQLLEHNAQVFHQISANIANYQIQENVTLLCQAWDNIMKIMNDTSDMPEIMKQMPPLPEKLNEELASTVFRRPAGSMQT